MLLSEIIKNIETAEVTNLEDFDIKQITDDSRQVKQGTLFAAINGAQLDGHNFIKEAVANGACAVMYANEDKFEPFKNSVRGIKTNDVSASLALAALNFYHHPEKLIKIIGVTGTNGKTTTTILINEILKQAGIRTVLAGTLYIEFDNKLIETRNTTPGSLEIIKTMSDMVKQGIHHLIMEVSSHALEQNRVYGIPFDAAVFTNLTPDHLDYHATMEDYFQAKLKLFKQMDMFKNSHRCPVAVLNADDERAPEIIKNTQSAVCTYGVKSEADLRAVDIKVRKDGLSYVLKGPDIDKKVNLNLLGYFNVYNSLAAVLTALKLGVNKDTIFKAIESALPVRGRFEHIDAGNYTIIVDYAHTPDGLKNLLSSVREIARGRIITVFGCGGDRDKTKRPVMGAIAAGMSDEIIITSDNPRSEDPMEIIKQIETGAREKADNYVIEPDREAAIKKAVLSAKGGDFVVIAGKGHETYQIFKDKTIHFDDREVVLKIIRDKGIEV